MVFTLKNILTCMGVTSALVLGGCENALKSQQAFLDMILPCTWVGDIDPVGFNEPSGICWHTGRKSLFIIGDEGDICEIGTDGSLIRQGHIRDADFEGIAHDPASGLLYVAVEEAESILEVHPETYAVLREFEIPREVDGHIRLGAGKEGIEAITFVPDVNHPNGGVFYVANQAFTLSDEQDISAVFQVELPLRDPADRVRITAYFEPGVIDLSGLCYDAGADVLLVISDATNTMMQYSRDHEMLRGYAFPGDNQEGIAVDPDGYLYIAQDSGGIIKMEWPH